MSRAEGRENGTHGATEGGLTERWRDKRVEQKRKRAAEVDRLRRSALRKAAHKSRSAALAEGRPRYQGHRCKRGHGGERYTNDGNCCECVRLARRRARGKFGPEKPRGRHPLNSSRRAAARAGRAAEMLRAGRPARVGRHGPQEAPRPAGRR